jgi:nitrous oxidase accessory protein
MQKRLLRKGLVLGIILLFVVTSIASGVQINSNPQPINGGWLYVGGSGPGNYSSIQSAIDDANPGDTIYVYSGTYNENVVVNKNDVTLIGEHKETTIIRGGGQTTRIIVGVSSNGVTISSFTIQNGLYSIHLSSSSKNNITNNNINLNYWGIHLHNSNNNIITKNNVNSSLFQGISLSSSSNNTITGNNISNLNNGYGIGLSYPSNNNIIMNNNISNNFGGISLIASSNNTILKNNFIKNRRHAGFVLCTNTWDQNYWGRLRIFPKPIFGIKKIYHLFPSFIEFDWNPAQEPYNITG